MVCNFDSIDKKTNKKLLCNFVTDENNTIIFVIVLSKLGKKNFQVVTVSSIISDHMVLFDLLVEQFVQLGRYLVNTIVDNCSFNRYHIAPQAINGWEFPLI